MKFLTGLTVLLILIIGTLATFAQTTVFNYQGKLTDTGTSQNSYQMRFELYDALVGGNKIGATITNSAVTVDQGVFTIQLDFGASVFTGANRFLEIAVRRNVGENYTILSPRQQINSSPYSIRTLSAAQADVALDASKLGGIDASQYVTTTSVGSSFIKNATTQQTGNFNINGNGIVGGNLGIGTTTPTSKLQVQAGGYGITQTSGGVTVGSFITTASGGSGWFGTQSNHPLNFFTNNSTAQMTLDTTGNFGIGTAPNAAYKLDVNGQTNVRTGGITGGGIILGTPNGETGLTINGTGTNRADIRFDGSTLKLLVAPPGGPPPATNGIAITSSGSVGIGTTTPRATLDIDENAVQNLNAGLVKAMLEVDGTGTIVRCYNGVTNSSTGNCGFAITQPLTGVFRINFGFPITDRFVSVTARYCGECFNGSRNTGANYRGFDNNSIEVFTYVTGSIDTSSRNFTLILY